jgi:hypothetical protein
MRLSALSLTVLRVPITELDGIAVATLVTYTVEGAVIDADVKVQAADFKAAVWSAPGDLDHPAMCLTVGPTSGVGALTADKIYAVYARITGGSIKPVIQAKGLLEVY